MVTQPIDGLQENEERHSGPHVFPLATIVLQPGIATDFWHNQGGRHGGSLLPGLFQDSVFLTLTWTVFVRRVGPKSNGYLWPNVVKFNVTKTEVWIQQISTGEIQYYLERPSIN